VIDELAWELAGRVKFAKLNIDENQRTASRFRVSSIPALFIFRDGQLVDQIVGAVPSQIFAQLQP
jgi:thioredoxin 1